MDREHSEAEWLRVFHAGDRDVLGACYREHCDKVLAAACRILSSVDAETVTHEVFYRLLSDPEMRASFRGGNLGGWLAVVAQRAALDHLRRRRREHPLNESETAAELERDPASESDETEAKMLIERFQRDVLPSKYRALFELRFLKQMSQREVARALSMQRTTLVYQEGVVRKLLERFLLNGAQP